MRTRIMTAALALAFGFTLTRRDVAAVGIVSHASPILVQRMTHANVQRAGSRRWS